MRPDTLTEPNVLPIYEHARQDPNLRVLVYNGDTDPGINSMVTQHKYMDYFDSLNVSESEAWRPWTLDGKQRMGGYVVSWPGNFHYLTIRGSGHMVPEYKPAATLASATGPSFARCPRASVAVMAQYRKFRYMQGMYSGMRGVSMTVACACQNVLLMGRIMKK